MTVYDAPHGRVVANPGSWGSGPDTAFVGITLVKFWSKKNRYPKKPPAFAYPMEPRRQGTSIGTLR